MQQRLQGAGVLVAVGNSDTAPPRAPRFVLHGHDSGISPLLDAIRKGDVAQVVSIVKQATSAIELYNSVRPAVVEAMLASSDDRFVSHVLSQVFEQLLHKVS